MANNSQVSNLTIDGVTYDLVDETSGYAKLASPAFTGTPIAPTASSGDSSTQIATTAFVQNAVSGVGTGTVTSVGVSNATNGGLSINGSPISSSGTITIGHSNVLSSAQTTQAVYPIKIDKNGHISEYGDAVTIPTVPSNIVNTITTTAGVHTAISSQKGNVSFNVPTKTSHLTNDSGYLTSSTGVTSVNGSTGAITIPTIPSITLNGSSSTSPSFYAPTTTGTKDYYLVSNGSGAPVWRQGVGQTGGTNSEIFNDYTNNTISGNYSHAEGSGTYAESYSHAEGLNTSAAYASHSEGTSTVASGSSSHAQNYGTVADQDYQTAIGRYNTENNTGNLFVIGNGSSPTTRADAFEIDNSGNTIASGRSTTSDMTSDQVSAFVNELGLQPTDNPVQSSLSMVNTTASADTYHNGASLTLDVGVYLVIAYGSFPSTTTSRAIRVTIYDATSDTRMMGTCMTCAYWSCAQAVSVLSLTEESTIYCSLSSSIAQTNCTSTLMAVRIR